jgi:hypothetical protein
VINAKCGVPLIVLDQTQGVTLTCRPATPLPPQPPGWHREDSHSGYLQSCIRPYRAQTVQLAGLAVRMTLVTGKQPQTEPARHETSAAAATRLLSEVPRSHERAVSSVNLAHNSRADASVESIIGVKCGRQPVPNVMRPDDESHRAGAQPLVSARQPSCDPHERDVTLWPISR